MKNFLAISGLMIGLIGCSTPPIAPENTYALGTETNDVLRNDIIKKINEVALPAKTTLTIQTPVDKFGQALINQLRKSGYAITETNPNDKKTIAVTGLKMIYTIDTVDEFTRITICLGNDRYSRAYTNNKAASAWTKGSTHDNK